LCVLCGESIETLPPPGGPIASRAIARAKRSFATACRLSETRCMRQLTCIGPGSIEWRDVPEPRLAGDGDALVRPLAVARCDIDLPLTSGAFPISQPFALGHECVAEIVALGAGVRGLEIGQRVVVAFQVSCGHCRSCTAGYTANCDAYPVLSDFGM